MHCSYLKGATNLKYILCINLSNILKQLIQMYGIKPISDDNI